MLSRKLEDNMSILYKTWFAQMLNVLSVRLELLHGQNKHFTVTQYNL